MTVTVRTVTADVVRPLRNRVLRPHRRDDVPPYDADPIAVHVAAFDGDVVVGCATVFPAAAPEAADAWQLRGMAVDPDRRGAGIGRLVVQAAVVVARDRGASLAWANARATALGFYQRNGWQVVSEEYIHGDSALPHKRIILPLLSSVPRTVGAAPSPAVPAPPDDGRRARDRPDP